MGATKDLIAAAEGMDEKAAADFRRGVADAISPPTPAEIEATPFVPLSDAYAAGYRHGRREMRAAARRLRAGGAR